jgi:hypothetical protein
MFPEYAFSNAVSFFKINSNHASVIVDGAVYDGTVVPPASLLADDALRAAPALEPAPALALPALTLAPLAAVDRPLVPGRGNLVACTGGTLPLLLAKTRVTVMIVNLQVFKAATAVPTQCPCLCTY